MREGRDTSTFLGLTWPPPHGVRVFAFLLGVSIAMSSCVSGCNIAVNTGRIATALEDRAHPEPTAEAGK